MSARIRGKRPARPVDGDPLPPDVSDLLTRWLVHARELAEPDTLDSCEDYLRMLDERHAATQEARALCERLRRRVATWVYVRRQ